VNSPVAPNAVPKKIQEMVQRIVDSFSPERIILFGSYARGTAGPDSDADLLVIKPIEGSKRQERIQIGIALQGMGLAKDILVATPEDLETAAHLPGSVLHDACREGLLLYERPLS
jgi:predicted nucleotidyltransferase